MATLTIGVEEEQESFRERNARFMEVLPRVTGRINEILVRVIDTADPAQKTVFFLGRLVAEDFMEIFVNCANGYGMAGLKLLRSMFEAVVTGLYLMRHPEEAEAFLHYHLVHQRKMLKVAESVGVDLSGMVSKEEQIEIERKYQEIKDGYRRNLCPECGAQLGDVSWTKKDPIAMARELGLHESAFSLYFYTTLHVHTTPLQVLSRLEKTPAGLRFKGKPDAQRTEADMAIAGAHGCIAMVLTEHNRYFGVGTPGLEKELFADLRNAWPGRPEVDIVAQRTEES